MIENVLIICLETKIVYMCLIGDITIIGWYDKLTENGFKFVTRGVKNSIVMEEKFLDSNINEDIYDTEVIMGSTPGGNLTFNKYREIMCFDENDEAIEFL